MSILDDTVFDVCRRTRTGDFVPVLLLLGAQASLLASLELIMALS
jgi:hypothetical protein